MSKLPENTLNSKDVLIMTTQFLLSLPLLISVKTNQLKVFAHILVYASTRNISISIACNDLSGVPSHWELLALRCKKANPPVLTL